MSALQEQLKERFGFEAIREGQEDAISRLLEGKPVLAIFLTGAGKSLCYQLPGRIGLCGLRI
jgi:ATP-dependent DNA helicase RecQ